MKLWNVCVLAVSILAGWSEVAKAQNPPPYPVVVAQQWHDTLPGDKVALRNLAPKAGYIIDQETWFAVWMAWRGGKAPQVDFRTQFVVVGVVRGASYPDGKKNEVWAGQGGRLVSYEGNLPLLFAGFDMDTPGFAYTLAVVQRGGITSIDGKPLPPPRINSATLASSVERLEKANADLRAAIEELRKQIDELKKRN